ncbi:hypothetical protein BDN70DRAFT_516778 [Pholiota conissans]|uniref:Uncharacterized protein n=1 Tax=Pholiota conissans TaxID=109636 RepID=A0A9P6CTC6_9AGAR|nr:hypothetical protein BDN70DRAFT_516778 [Pholiota conissans]
MAHVHLRSPFLMICLWYFLRLSDVIFIKMCLYDFDCNAQYTGRVIFTGIPNDRQRRCEVVEYLSLVIPFKSPPTLSCLVISIPCRVAFDDFLLDGNFWDWSGIPTIKVISTRSYPVGRFQSAFFYPSLSRDYHLLSSNTVPSYPSPLHS